MKDNQIKEPCKHCKGTGFVRSSLGISHDCLICNGTGMIFKI
jgi:DnaJ-class molecular chaperone